MIEARDRVGGRVHTIREGRLMHAEAGADLIEGEQSNVLALAREVRLTPHRILRLGFGYYGPDRAGRRRMFARPKAFEDAARR